MGTSAIVKTVAILLEDLAFTVYRYNKQRRLHRSQVSITCSSEFPKLCLIQFAPRLKLRSTTQSYNNTKLDDILQLYNHILNCASSSIYAQDLSQIYCI